MIYLTGDVHNLLGAQLDQIHCGVHEPSAALRYSQIAAEAGVKATLFVTGLAVVEASEIFEAVGALGNIEFGGHGWDSFRNHATRTLLWSMFGTRYGPRNHQKRDIERTKSAFFHRLGTNITTWRNHALYADENTYPLLVEAGIRAISDRLVETLPIAEVLPGLTSVPINTMLDHDSVLHGGITQSAMDDARAALRALRNLTPNRALSWKQNLAVLARRACRNVIDVPVLDHSGEYLYADKKTVLLDLRAWETRLYREIEERLDNMGFATLLLHPVCMAVLDDFAAFRRIVTFCSKFETRYVTEAIPTTQGSTRDVALPVEPRWRY